MLGVYSESGDELELTSDPVEIALITYTSCLQKNSNFFYYYFRNILYWTCISLTVT
jgi:hypothetical protein